MIFRILLSLCVLPVLVIAQRPSATEYDNVSVSADGRTLYGSTSIEGTMTGNYPPSVTHTYTAGFTLVAPHNSGIASVPCSDSQAGNPDQDYDPGCYQSISSLFNGIFLFNLGDTAVCSYAGTFYTNSGTSETTFTYDANSLSTFLNNVSLLTGQSVSTLQSAVNASGMLANTQGPLTAANISNLAPGVLAGATDAIDPTFNGYVGQFGYNYASPTTLPASPNALGIPALIESVLTTIGSTAAVGALVLGSILIMDGDHPAKWTPGNSASCTAQQEADVNTCKARFPYGTNQGAKYKACITHSWVRYTLCMKNQSVPPLQPVN